MSTALTILRVLCAVAFAVLGILAFASAAQSGQRNEAATGFVLCALGVGLSGVLRKAPAAMETLGADSEKDEDFKTEPPAAAGPVRPLLGRVEAYETLADSLPTPVLEEIALAEMARAKGMRSDVRVLGTMRSLSNIAADGTAPDAKTEAAYRGTLKRMTMDLAVGRLTLSLDGDDPWDLHLPTLEATEKPGDK